MLIVMLVSTEALSSTDVEWNVRIDNLKNDWLIAATIWRLEFVCVLCLAWSSFHFSSRHSAWYIVAIAHILMMMLYGIMLGGYPEVSSEEGYKILYQIGLWFFSISNFLWLFGMFFIFMPFTGWLKYTGTAVSGICAIAFLGVFFEIIGFEQIFYVMPLLIVMYILNAIVGIRLAKIPA